MIGLDRIVELIALGQWNEAKYLLQYLCKDNPERQAYRLARVAIKMTSEGHGLRATRFINMFDVNGHA